MSSAPCTSPTKNPMMSPRPPNRLPIAPTAMASGPLPSPQRSATRLFTMSNAAPKARTIVVPTIRKRSPRIFKTGLIASKIAFTILRNSSLELYAMISPATSAAMRPMATTIGPPKSFIVRLVSATIVRNAPTAKAEMLIAIVKAVYAPTTARMMPMLSPMNFAITLNASTSLPIIAPATFITAGRTCVTIVVMNGRRYSTA